MKMLNFMLLALLFAPVSRKPALAQGTPAPPQTDAMHTEVGVDILSDRGGVDLNPYLQHMVDALNRRWRPLLKEATPQAITGRQTTVIGVTILQNGHLGAMRLVSPTHQDALNEALNKAAWTATKQNDFQPPPPLRDGRLKLRLNFIVN